MSRANLQKMKSSERSSLLNLLWVSIAQLKSREETEAFFKALLSESEAIMLARRIKIAQLLLDGDSYAQIEEKIGAGKTTIAKVHNWLNSDLGKREAVIAKFDKRAPKIQREAQARYPEPFSYEWIKRKYPLHFLLFNLLDEAGDALRRNKNKKNKPIA